MNEQDCAGENDFWTYSLAVYRRKEVVHSCLALQDNAGVDVNLLLYAGWLAGKGQRLDSYHLEQVASAVADWREQVVKPLRDLRRHLSTIAGAELLCEALKAQELSAEQQQQDTMYSCYRALHALPAGEHCLRENLTMVCRYSNPRAAALPDSLESLVLALGR